MYPELVKRVIYFLNSTVYCTGSRVGNTTTLRREQTQVMPSLPAPEDGVEGPGAIAVAAIPRPVVGLHGFVGAFDLYQEDWSEYTEHLEHYFTANEINSEKQRAILLNAVDTSAYCLIRTLVSPAKVREVSLDEIVMKAKAHFTPSPHQSSRDTNST